MYQQIKHLSIEKQIEYVTRQLIAIESINGTAGEVELANTVQRWLQTFPYFEKDPANVWEQYIPNDSIGRKNIFAFLRSPSGSSKTIIYHAHMDTVGVDDFGNMKMHSLNSDALESYFKKYPFNQEVQKDALSGDYLFGRGSVDMQSGLAVHIANLLYFSEHLDELPGNILFMTNSDEESQHKGVTTSISEINRLKKEEGLDYVAAINTDFITPMYKGDPHRYIYTGSAGKLLPSFYIYGRETHVGDTLSGIDPTLISSEINRRINNNLDLTENIDGELILPPSCLYQKDTKTSYNVQTPKSSYLYFNYFIYESTGKEVMDRLEEITNEACLQLAETAAQQYGEFAERSNLPAAVNNQRWNIEVTTLADFILKLEAMGLDPRSKSKQVVTEYRHLDERMLCFKIAEELQQLDPDKKPRVIIFFAPPYLPHNFLNENKEKDKKLLQMIHETIDHASKESNEVFSINKFFPYLADGSFLSLHETDEEISALVDNFPEIETLYPIPFNDIRKLDVPSINMGVYGKDGHKWTERVYKPYSFGVLPTLIRDTTVRLLTAFHDSQIK
ncbi:peptidase M20 [Virgibacillus phasianinus]|uniref:Peptidase M20 n=1 Tax=Virgibacillus phasianinus TaxID=2017483 RepID=A0A220U0J8_9BACI|nr:M20/M25/M40 family metallo-hydrolase [Virgibacillus phasianinus]ASK61512.1 peptidase M20 [Virgibacillus phasianinus]